MYLAKIYITYKPSILDPKGETIKDALKRLDFTNVEDVTMGKYFEIKLKASTQQEVEQEVVEFTQKLLININMETFRYEVKEIKE